MATIVLITTGAFIPGQSFSKDDAGTETAAPAKEQAVAEPNVYPLDFALVLEQREARKFNANDIRSFVYRIFSMYDHATSKAHRIGPEEFRPLLADNIRMDFPDYQIHDWAEFVTWHKWIHGRLVADDHQIGPIEVGFLNDGRYEVHFVVLWRALFKTGEFMDIRIEQTWRLRGEANHDLPVLESLVAKVADFRVK